MIKPFIVILAICLSILALGCGSDQYSIEREYWYVQKQAEKIFQNPNASPPNELERSVKALADFSRKHPKNKLAVEAEFNIAKLYLIKKEFDNARRQLVLMQNKFVGFDVILSETEFLIGTSYELEDKWALALGHYKRIMEAYAATQRGIEIPLYIALHYKAKFQPDRMLSAYQEAVSYYKDLAVKYPDSTLSLSAHNLIARCYIDMKDWQGAVRAINEIIDKYRGKVKLDEIFLRLALIYKNELKDSAKEKETLEALIKEYPESKLVKPATALLKEAQEK